MQNDWTEFSSVLCWISVLWTKNLTEYNCFRWKNQWDLTPLIRMTLFTHKNSKKCNKVHPQYFFGVVVQLSLFSNHTSCWQRKWINFNIHERYTCCNIVQKPYIFFERVIKYSIFYSLNIWKLLGTVKDKEQSEEQEEDNSPMKGFTCGGLGLGLAKRNLDPTHLLLYYDRFRRGT